MPYFLYIIECSNKALYTGSAASKREAQIKGWTRTKKLALIKGAREMTDLS